MAAGYEVGGEKQLSTGFHSSQTAAIRTMSIATSKYTTDIGLLQVVP